MDQERIVIVGAGIVGLSTAYALLKQGMRDVTVLEQATVAHERAASHGLSRLLRFEYGSDFLYSEMVRLSLTRWRQLEHESKRTLYTPRGLLVLGHDNDNYTKQSYYLLREMGFPTQLLSQQSCAQQFPQFNTHAYDILTYNRDAGILHASYCLQTLKERILALGGHIYEDHRVKSIRHDKHHQPIRLDLHSEETILADRVVLSVGPWVHQLLRELHLPVRLTRQYLLYFANLPMSSFSLQNFPTFIAGDLYGFPIHKDPLGKESGWFKAASHSFGAPAAPDEVPPLDRRVIWDVAQQLYDLLPALQQADLVHIDSCIYDVSPDEDFILDYFPDDPRLVFATGLTGHGFKFGPLLGELLASLVLQSAPLVSLDRFQLARFAKHRQTPVSSAV